MKTVMLQINKCKECPNLEIGNLYSLDGFDRGCDWTCKKANKKIAGFIERTSEEPKEIPDWCPLASSPDNKHVGSNNMFVPEGYRRSYGYLHRINIKENARLNYCSINDASMWFEDSGDIDFEICDIGLIREYLLHNKNVSNKHGEAIMPLNDGEAVMVDIEGCVVIVENAVLKAQIGWLDWDRG